MSTTDRGLRVAMLSYRGQAALRAKGIYLRHVSREVAALGHHVEVFSGQPYPELEPGQCCAPCRASTCTGSPTRSARRT